MSPGRVSPGRLSTGGRARRLTRTAAGAAWQLSLLVSPRPGASVLRRTFAANGAAVDAALASHVPVGVEEVLDEPYGDGPEERLDVYRPTGAEPLPTVVWIHGGGWIGGSKEELANWCRLIAGQGFAVVPVGYSLAPARRYPTPVRQALAALAHLQANAARLGVDAERIVLAGDSAGAQIAAQVALIATDSGYANAVGLASTLAAGRLRGLVLACGPFDLSHATGGTGAGTRFMTTALWAYSGRRRFADDPDLALASVVDHLTRGVPAHVRHRRERRPAARPLRGAGRAARRARRRGRRALLARTPRAAARPRVPVRPRLRRRPGRLRPDDGIPQEAVAAASAAASSRREFSCSLRYALDRCTSTVFTVTKSACAISLLVRSSAASSATRRSLGVRASRPVTRLLRGRAPDAASSSLPRSTRPSTPVREREVDAARQHLARLRALAVAAVGGAQVDQRARVLELRLGAVEHLDRLLQQAPSLGAALDEAAGAQRRADLVRRAPAARDLELLVGERARLVGAAEAQQPVDGEPPPRESAGLSNGTACVTSPSASSSATPRSTSPDSIQSRPRPRRK